LHSCFVASTTEEHDSECFQMGRDDLNVGWGMKAILVSAGLPADIMIFGRSSSAHASYLIQMRYAKTCFVGWFQKSLWFRRRMLSGRPQQWIEFNLCTFRLPGWEVQIHKIRGINPIVEALLSDSMVVHVHVHMKKCQDSRRRCRCLVRLVHDASVPVYVRERRRRWGFARYGRGILIVVSLWVACSLVLSQVRKEKVSRLMT
jgi:hypothetical protein